MKWAPDHYNRDSYVMIEQYVYIESYPIYFHYVVLYYYYHQTSKTYLSRQ